MPAGDVPGEIRVDDLTRLICTLLKLSPEKQAAIQKEWAGFVRGKRVGDLNPDAQAKLLFNLARLKKCRNYILHELTEECSNDCTRELVQQVKTLLAGQCRVVYLSRLGCPNPLLNVDRYFIITKEGSNYESKEIL